MTPSAAPVTTDVVLVGAGHAHVTVLRMAGMNPVPGVRYTLVTREVHTPYSGMLPGLIAGHYDFDQAHIDTGPLCRFARARLYRTEAIGLDLERKLVLCRDRPPVPYDVLSLDIGSRPNTGEVPGASQHATPVKPIDHFLVEFEALLGRVLARRGRAHVALVGAGAGGVELLLSVQVRLRNEVTRAGHDPAGLSFSIVSATPRILPAFPDAFSRRFEAILKGRGIAILAPARVVAVEPSLLRMADGPDVAADEILWVTQAAPHEWLARTGLPVDDRGFVRVGQTLQADGFADVFAAGDTASFGPRKLPKSGVYAVRSGPVLAANIRRLVAGEALEPFRPQRDAMYLVSTGDGFAVGSRNGVTFAGRWVWLWKDWIDRRFMAKFNELPEMAGPAARDGGKDAQGLSVPDMRCGGCGAKVGATVLSRALSGLSPLPRPEVLVGLDAPDDAAILDTGGPDLSVQTVDFFRAMVDDPWLFGRIAANHALSDVFAMGGEPVSAMAIATLPHGPEAKLEADLSAMMQGANEALSQAGCALVGGHTGEGAELALGFAVTGRVARDRLLTKGGARPGDALVLTKALGTGALFAADMRGKARARWIMAALDQMQRSNGPAARILVSHGAHAMTDVTGFGLLGHSLEMLRASGVGAEVWPERLPALAGAREVLASGIASSLQPENLRSRHAVALPDDASRDLDPLLFDPQTAGGLLAAVPSDKAQACVDALREAGFDQATIIGMVTDPAGETPVRLAPAPSG